VLADLIFELANRQLGALIALERDVPLSSWMENGVEIDGLLSSELVVSLFHPRTPLHDGGLLIRDNRVLAAACIFPVTDRTDIDRNLGLRHRAALGLSEETDAIVLVVSEETGTVSICYRGALERGFEPATFRTRLGELLSAHSNEKNA
jgi:diadenylate cyclase